MNFFKYYSYIKLIKVLFYKHIYQISKTIIIKTKCNMKCDKRMDT